MPAMNAEFVWACPGFHPRKQTAGSSGQCSPAPKLFQWHCNGPFHSDGRGLKTAQPQGDKVSLSLDWPDCDPLQPAPELQSDSGIP